MARIVTITQPTDTVRCGPDGRAAHVFTVTNISGASLRIGAQALVEGSTQASWLTIEGPSERDLGINASDQITVRAHIPADTPPGKYTFHLLVFSVKRPGEDYTEGETVAIEVPPTAKPEPAPQPPKRFPWWVPAAVVAVLLIGGVIAWLVWPKGIEVPKVVGKPLADAQAILKKAGLEVEVQGGAPPTDDQPPGTVTEQDPTAESRVEEGTRIRLTVAMQKLQAAFTADGPSGVAPLTVKFKDQSRGDPTSWRWDFGDGKTLTEQNPTHIYNKAGSYAVSLTVMRGTEASPTETRTNFIIVKEPADIPKGLVAFFSGKDCPSGWRVAEYAQGRLIVAVDEGGVVGKQVGAKPLKDQEDPKHTHTYTGRVNLGGKGIAAASGGGNMSATSRGDHQFSGTTKEAPTGLPFIQYVICEKQ